jgi:hypothetical protein
LDVGKFERIVLGGDLGFEVVLCGLEPGLGFRLLVQQLALGKQGLAFLGGFSGGGSLGEERKVFGGFWQDAFPKKTPQDVLERLPGSRFLTS